MAIPPASPSNSEEHTSSQSDTGPSKSASSPANKRAASTSLSDSETLVTKTPQTPDRLAKISSGASNAHRRKRRRRASVSRRAVSLTSVHDRKRTSSTKGKERVIETENRAVEAMGNNTAHTDAKDEVALLRAKLDQQATLLNAYNAFFTHLAPSITCQICLDPMYRPYTLAPCGHTGCYDCLLAWFRAPPAHIGQSPPQHLAHNFDLDNPTLLARDAPMLLRKEKTCPHCRAVVRDAPVEAWGIKDIVHHLFTHTGDAANDLFPSHTRPVEANQVAAASTGPEAWMGVFKRARIPGIANRHGGDEARDLDDEDDHRDRGFYDDEDGVHRCLTCNYEILDGICSSCGREYPGLHSGFDGEDEEIDARYWMDAEEFGGFDDGDPVYPDRVFGGHADLFMDALGHGRAMSPEHEEEGDDEENYESSFIDDGEDGHARIEEYHSAEDADIYHSEDEEMSDDGETQRPRRLVPPRIAYTRIRPTEAVPTRRVAAVELTDYDSDLPAPPGNYRGTQTRRTRIESDGEESESDGHRVSRVSRAIGHGVIDSDSDSGQEEDAHSDAGHSRNYRFYSRSFSDDESLSGEGSDHSSRCGSYRSELSHENYYNYAFSDEEDVVLSD